MRRRDFISLVGGAAAWPLAAHAQQPTMPVIGFLGLTSPQEFAAQTRAFQRGLGETGFTEGQNVAFEYRWAHGQFDRLPALASELVRQHINVFAAMGTPASALAAKAATTIIPIVFVTGSDPVAMGLAESFNRPGGNATGIYMLTTSLEPKRLELVHELVPDASVIGAIVDPTSPEARRQVEDLSTAANELHQPTKMFNASTDVEIDSAFAAMAEQKVKAALVTSSPHYLPLRQRFITLAARYAIPTVYYFRDFADDGGLLSYGTSLNDTCRQQGVYAGRILKGEVARDLPIQQSIKVELVINLKTAKTLGLVFPLTLLGRADEVIE
jgi:putative tryptophan/tyrosine transport system substrate-binding protein